MMLEYVLDLLNECARDYGLVPAILHLLPEEFELLLQEVDIQSVVRAHGWGSDRVRYIHPLGEVIILSRRNFHPATEWILEKTPPHVLYTETRRYEG